MLTLLAAYSIKKGAASRGPRRPVPAGERRRALRAAAWELPLPVIVLGGIYGGFFVVGEAAAVTALYVLIVEVCVHRDITPARLPGIVVRSMALFGGIFVVLAASMASTSFLIDQEIPAKLFAIIREHISSKYTFLLLLNIFLLMVGALLDIFSALVLVVPLIVPIAQGYGVDPTHLGIIFLTNLQIGYCTPPVGLDLFLASYRFERPITELYTATLPFLAILLVTLGIITYFPLLSLFLIGLFG
jgi:tripartite ATP-independent transporter DctM subunit